MVGGRQVLGLLLFASSAFAAPSFSSGNLDSLSLIPIGGQLDTRTLHGLDTASFEIRGVVGGRKKRFVVGRAADPDDACCPNTKCDKAKQFKDRKDCKCKDCPKGKKPSANGKYCIFDCPEGQKEDTLMGKCIVECPKGKKPDGKGEKCVDEKMKCPAGEKLQPDGKTCKKQETEQDPKKQGKCPKGQILDPAEGGQDEKTENPKCVIDDSSKCPKGQVPESRSSDDQDPNMKVECAKEPAEKDRAKCNKNQYKVIQVQSLDDGNKAVEHCEYTRKYKDGKNKKIDDIKPKKQKKWNDEKPQREKAKEEERKRKEEEERKKKEQREEWEKEEKERERNAKKKTRIGRCLPLTAVMQGAYEFEEKYGKRDIDGAVIDGGLGKREDSQWFEWTTEYFDEEWIQSDEVLDLWPKDLEFNEDVDIDNDDFTEAYAESIQRIQLRNGPGQCGGTKRKKRCIPRRMADGNVTYEEDFFESDEEETEFTARAVADAEAQLAEVQRQSAEMEKRGVDENGRPLEKRFWQIIPAILSFLARLAVTAARVAPSLARMSPRLAGLLKDTNRLFRLAQPGKGASVAAQRTAARELIKRSTFRRCLEGGKP